MKTPYFQFLSILAAIILTGCGGSAGPTSSSGSSANSSVPTAAQIIDYSDSQIVALGTSVSQLSDAALEALAFGTNANNPTGQIESLTPSQLAALSPAQVQLIGAADAGGAPGVAQISYLNTDAWAEFAGNPAQVAALTAVVVPTLTGNEIAALATNFNQLSDAALAALTYSTNPITNPIGQIESITPIEIGTLTPAQVRLIGATGPGGVTGTSAIRWLNAGTWSALVGNTAQVVAITSDEIPTLSDDEIVALNANINQLSTVAIAALTSGTDAANPNGQIESIAADQIAVLSPAQVQVIGAAGPDGVNTTPLIRWLNSGAWATLVGNPAQVAAMTSDDIPTLSDNEIAAMGTNINQLNDSALAALTYGTNAWNPNGQIESLTTAQIAILSPVQVSLIASIAPGTAIAYLNLGAFSTMSANQVAELTPANVADVSAPELASLSLSALAGLMPSTIADLTTSQKTMLSPAQHAACGC
jgi:hypothetical protein